LYTAKDGKTIVSILNNSETIKKVSESHVIKNIIYYVHIIDCTVIASPVISKIPQLTGMYIYIMSYYVKMFGL